MNSDHGQFQDSNLVRQMYMKKTIYNKFIEICRKTFEVTGIIYNQNNFKWQYFIVWKKITDNTTTLMELIKTFEPETPPSPVPLNAHKKSQQS